MSDKKAADTLKYVDIDKLKPSQFNSYPTDDYADLKASIEAIGLLTPITVISDDDDSYQIISGERRYRAVCDIHADDETKFARVPVYVIGKNDMDSIRQQINIEVSNLETRSDSDYNVHDHRFRLLELIRDISNSPEEEDKMVADVFQNSMHVSPRYKNMYRSIFNSGNENLVRIAADPKNHARIADVSKATHLDREKQDEMVRRVDAGENAKDVYDDLSGKKKEKEKNEEAESTESKKTSYEEDAYEPDDSYDDLDSAMDAFNELADELGIGDNSEDDSDDELPSPSKQKKGKTLPSAAAVAEWMNNVMQKSYGELSSEELNVYRLAKKWTKE